MMVAVDTNILARFYVDDPADSQAARQKAAAIKALQESSVFVPITVVLEFEWVLRAFYDFNPTEVSRVFRHLMGLPNVHVQDWHLVDQAIDAHLKGMDFADALHLSQSGHCARLFTFDRKLARAASAQQLAPLVSIPQGSVSAKRPG